MQRVTLLRFCLSDITLCLSLIHPLPEGENKSVPRGLVMASCLPVAHVLGYICIEFFKNFVLMVPYCVLSHNDV
jgi:hypothetical protein